MCNIQYVEEFYQMGSCAIPTIVQTDLHTRRDSGEYMITTHRDHVTSANCVEGDNPVSTYGVYVTFYVTDTRVPHA